MGLAEFERRKDEKIDGVVYNISLSPGYQHGIINSNIHPVIKQGLKNSICLVSIENLDFKYHPEENDDIEDEEYNAETEITLRGFPHIRMTLAEVFEGVD